MKGYWLVLGTAVADQSAQDDYNRLWRPIAEKYGAKINPGTPPVLKEGRDTARLIVVEFPSLQAATDCYEDPAYQEAMAFAHKAAQRNLVIFGGDLG